jgi:hypothetical protein
MALVILPLGEREPAWRHQPKAATIAKGTRSAPRLTRVELRSENHDGDEGDNAAVKRSIVAHQMTISTITKTTGRRRARPLRRRRVLESCNPVLLVGPTIHPRLPGVSRALLRVWTALIHRSA